MTDKIAIIEKKNYELQDKVNKLKLDRLEGDDSLETETLIKEFEKEIEENKEIIKQENTNLEMIMNIKDDAQNRIEEIEEMEIMESDKPLKEKIEAIFKSKGFTLAAVLAAITMLFSTIGLAISNALLGGGSTPAPTPAPAPMPSIPDRVKEGLKKFAEWLFELSKKSAADIPGIIGSIVSFLLKTIGQVVGFMAEHVIIFLILVVSSIIYGLIEGVKEIKRSRN